jgi:UDP-N-acetylmuramate--alanine ligase
MDFEKLLAPGAKAYFIGIKGTGMCALAELFHNRGIAVSGSDGAEVFYTDAILKELGIPYHESFEKGHVRDDAGLVVHSAAYTFDANPEMAEARKRGLPILKYTDALGLYSGFFDSSGIAGVHGKTTTTAMSGALLRAAGIPAQVLAGSAVAGFGGRSTLSLGDKYFVAETCEYRRHFLSFNPKRIVLTSVESDHQDFYPTYASIRDAFLDYVRKLPENGGLIYCADDPGASEVAASIKSEGRGVKFIPYGFSAEGAFRILSYTVKDERAHVAIAGFPGEIKLKVSGRHNALDAAAALALTSSLVRNEAGNPDGKAGGTGDAGSGWGQDRVERVRAALEEFSGSRRRQEIVGEAGGIIFIDDYGHHPSAIKTTLEGFKAFYPGRRLVLSIMSHTYSRPASLLDEYASSLAKADIVFLHKNYASAREEYKGGVTGKTLFEKTKAAFNDRGNNVYYSEEPDEAAGLLKALLKSGDLFVTMGAGNNWTLGRILYDYYRGG